MIDQHDLETYGYDKSVDTKAQWFADPHDPVWDGPQKKSAQEEMKPKGFRNRLWWIWFGIKMRCVPYWKKSIMRGMHVDKNGTVTPLRTYAVIKDNILDHS